jgi:hypothetical protein
MIGAEERDFSIVALDTFIQATRDSGYKGTGSAVAELVDNSLQAGNRARWPNLFQRGKQDCSPEQ